MSFIFSKDNLQLAEKILSKYPIDKKQSAILELLHLAQVQNGFISNDVVSYIAEYIEMPEIHVHEVVSFYSMFFTKKQGKYVLQFCGTTPCMLRGSEKMINFCKKYLNIADDQSTTEDMIFTVQEVECLGACISAPVMQVNNQEYYENLTEDGLEKIIKKFNSK